MPFLIRRLTSLRDTARIQAPLNSSRLREQHQIAANPVRFHGFVGPAAPPGDRCWQRSARRGRQANDHGGRIGPSSQHNLKLQSPESLSKSRSGRPGVPAATFQVLPGRASGFESWCRISLKRPPTLGLAPESDRTANAILAGLISGNSSPQCNNFVALKRS